MSGISVTRRLKCILQAVLSKQLTRKVSLNSLACKFRRTQRPIARAELSLKPVIGVIGVIGVMSVISG